jgi:DNA-binding transcriptional regulator YhcF (GntR family)
LKQLVESDSTQTVRELAVHTQISTNTIDRHLDIIGKAKKTGSMGTPYSEWQSQVTLFRNLYFFTKSQQ